MRQPLVGGTQGANRGWGLVGQPLRASGGVGRGWDWVRQLSRGLEVQTAGGAGWGIVSRQSTHTYPHTQQPPTSLYSYPFSSLDVSNMF